MKTSKWLCMLVVASVAILRSQDSPVTNPQVAVETYASLGSSFADEWHLGGLNWNDAQIEAFVRGLRASLNGKPLALTPEASTLQKAIRERRDEIADEEVRSYFADPTRVETFMRRRAKDLGLQRSDTGLAFRLTPQPGTSRPGPDDSVVLSLDAYRPDGQTEVPGLKVAHRRMRVSDLLPGLAEAVQMMNDGSSGIFLVPPALSFGSGPWPDSVQTGIPLVFRITVHEVIVGE